MRDYLFMHIHIGTLRVLGNLLSYCTLSHPKARHNQEKTDLNFIDITLHSIKKESTIPKPFYTGRFGKSLSCHRQSSDLPATKPYFAGDKSLLCQPQAHTLPKKKTPVMRNISTQTKPLPSSGDVPSRNVKGAYLVGYVPSRNVKGACASEEKALHRQTK